MTNLEQAKLLINQGLPLVPCRYREKRNFDKDILTKDYSLSSFNEENNIAIQLDKAEWVAIDPENLLAIKAAETFLGHLDTFKTIRIHNNKSFTVGYFFKNDGLLDKDIPLDKDIMEVRAGGIHILHGETLLKGTEATYVQRRISNNVEPMLLTEEILRLAKLAAFSAAVVPHVNQRFNRDNVALKLDACISRYCDWSDEKRIQFLKDFYSIAKDDYQDISEADYARKVRNNNKNQIKAGYKSLSEEFNGVSKYKVKDWFNWIGKVNEVETKKIVVSFKEHRVTKDQLKKKVERFELVEGIFPDHGLCILAGRPKSGKSVLARQLGYGFQNSTADTFLGKKFNLHGDCLCLFLEDDSDSMALHTQNMKFTDLNEPTLFVGQCPQITRGLEESIELWIEESENAKLIIIDTFQKIKPLYTKGGNNANAYEIDYHYLSILKQLADKHKLLIVYLHHLKQAKVDYNWDRIMGSTGHQGVTDAMYILDRDELGSSAKFMGRGRTIKDFEYGLQFDPDNYTYENTMKAPMVHVANEIKRKIYLAMKKLGEKGEHSVRPSDVCDILGIPPKTQEANNISKTMLRMRAPGTNQELRLGDKSKTYSLPPHIPHYQIDDEGNYIHENTDII